MLTGYLLPFLLSLFDTASIMILIMSVFDIPIKYNIVRTVLSIIILTLLSTILVFAGLHAYSLYILIPSLILTFIFVYKENFVYSLWISIFSVSAFLLLQQFLQSLFLIGNKLTYEDLKPFSIYGYIGQVITFIIISIISLRLRVFGQKFMFDFDNIFKRKKNIASSKPYTLISTVVLTILVAIYPKYYNNNLNLTFYLIFVLMILSFFILLLFSIKRDKDENREL